jgi:hypothetical protein
MQPWQKALRLRINRWRMNAYRRNRRSHRAAKNELRDAQVWCASRVDLSRPKECLRSEELMPPLLAASRLETVDDVRMTRERWIGYKRLPRELPPEATVGGRLIAYSPDFNLACGMSEAETRGYFDVNNIPPWDTWVALLDVPNAKFFENSLIAWVPPAFVPLAQAGINVIPEICVMWLEDCPAALRRQWANVATTERERPRLLSVS